MLEATNIEVNFGRRTILDSIGFGASPGQMTAIVGPNGSGKTTLLRALTGDVPHRGKVRLNGRDISGVKAWELAAVRGVLPQATRLAFPFTVLEVVRLGLIRGVDARSADLIPQALARVGLLGFDGRYYQELSGGEQQRVQLARVLAQVWSPVEGGEPRWLFLDEPVSALDIGHQLQVMQIARDYADAGGGVVAVMHDLNLTAMFADRVTLIGDGQVLADGAPREVLTDEFLSKAYRCPVRVNEVPVNGHFILPHASKTAAE